MVFGAALIVGIVAFVIVSVLIIIIVHKILKAAFMIIALFFIIFLILGFFVYKDIVDMQKNFGEKNNIVLIESGGRIVGGVIGRFSGEEAAAIKDVSSYDSDYQANDYESILGDDYKLFIFKEGAFDKTDDVEMMGGSYSSDFIVSLLKSDKPIDDYVDNDVSIKGLSGAALENAKSLLRGKIRYSDTEFKSVLFGTLLAKAMEDKQFFFILEQYKEGDVVVYKETITFKVIKAIPVSFIKKLAAKGKTKIEGMIIKAIGGD